MSAADRSMAQTYLTGLNPAALAASILEVRADLNAAPRDAMPKTKSFGR